MSKRIGWSEYIERASSKFQGQRARAGRVRVNNLTERFAIRPNDERYPLINKVSHQATNFFNVLTYHYRKNFEHNKWVNYRKLDRMVAQLYRAEQDRLPTLNYARAIARRVQDSFQDFERRNQEFSQNPYDFNQRPKLPYYHKKGHRSKFDIDIDDITVDQQMLTITSLGDLKVKLRQDIGDIQVVRIVPKVDIFILEVVYRAKSVHDSKADNQRYLAIDPGLNNAFTLTSNVPGLRPVIINGRPIKSYNRYWNQRIDRLKIIHAQLKQPTTSHEFRRLKRARYLKMERFGHASSRYIIDYAREHHLNTIIIGDNRSWQNADYQERNNGHRFVRIPYQTFVDKIIYKGAKAGIPVIVVNESYTSQTSFLDNERPNWDNGDANRKRNHISPNTRRVHRGLFKTNQYRSINSDVNGSLQILRKAVPNAFKDGITGIGLYPVKHNVDC